MAWPRGHTRAAAAESAVAAGMWAKAGASGVLGVEVAWAVAVRGALMAAAVTVSAVLAQAAGAGGRVAGQAALVEAGVVSLAVLEGKR